MKPVTLSILVLFVLSVNYEKGEALPTNFTNNGGRMGNGIQIVGGVPVNIEDYPYQVSVQYYGQHMCGGSIIAPNYILTAAHCTDGQLALNLNVRAGSSYHAQGGQSIRVARIHQNPGYNKLTQALDTSILELESNLLFGHGVQSIPLAQLGTRPSAGMTAIATGWGYLWENGPIPDQLQGVEVPVISQLDCESAYFPALITDSMLCAGYLGVGGKDACQGDSGGPLVIGGVQVGITSWGYGCADPRYPGVYANVGNILVRTHITTVTGI